MVYTHTHTDMHAYALMHVCMHVHTMCSHTHIHIHMCIYANVCSHTHTKTSIANIINNNGKKPEFSPRLWTRQEGLLSIFAQLHSNSSETN